MKTKHKPEPRRVVLKAEGGKVRQDQKAVVMREVFMHLAQAKIGAQYLESPQMEKKILEAGNILVAMGTKEQEK